MTTDELERDLKTLAEPQEATSACASRFAHSSANSAGAPKAPLPDPSRARSGRCRGRSDRSGDRDADRNGRVGGPASANAAIIPHAVRAISSPANIIVHVKETGVQDGTPVAAEWWQQTSPPYAMRLIKGAVDRQGEGANDGTTSSWYDAGTNTIYQRPASSSPTLIDPLSTVREQLASGSAQVAGTVTIDGQSLYKIELPNGVVGYFDRTDYRPVYLDNPQRDGSIVRTRVITYEELPITPENEQLLSITAQHPRASVDTNDPGAGSAGSKPVDLARRAPVDATRATRGTGCPRCRCSPAGA